jgi:aryl-alcohol dehydrogenase (NADP+)
VQYVNLGRTGLKVSRICLGMMSYGTPRWRPWVLDEDASRPIVRHAVELGVNFFDTADFYSAGASEELTGKLLREFTRRDEVVVATKVFFPVGLDYAVGGPHQPQGAPNASGLSRKHVLAAVDASLRRLGLDHVDLYQVHRWDYATPIEETMEALNDVVRAGKARYLGASSMYAWQFAKAQEAARANGWTPFVSMQNHYNLVYREEEREMIPLCRDQGIGLIPWSPLARGFLAGNRRADDAAAGATPRARTDELALRYYYGEQDFAVVEAVSRVAAARGVPNAQVAYAWLLHRGVTAPVIGATRLPHLDDAAAAAGLALSAEEVGALEAPYRPHPVLGHA